MKINEAKNVGNDDFVGDMQFITDIFSNGITRDVNEKDLQRWMANPEKYKSELGNYAIYQYISNGDIFQLFDLVKVLPNLNYKIKSLKTDSKNDKYSLECRRALKDIDHKEITRDLLSQTISSGTLVGLWVGREGKNNKEYPYPIIFDDLEFFFPGRRKNGKWTVWCDLSYFSKKSGIEIEDLSPYITAKDYKNYIKKGESFRYVEFPLERSICIRTHTLKRNQRFGIPWNTQALSDLKHKEKLRNLEKVASNKVMNAVAVLTLGIAGSQDSTYKKLGEKLTRSTFENVKKGLDSNNEGESNVVGLPEFAKLEYPSQKTDVLNPDKMVSIAEDINNSTGITRTLTNGKGGNYASSKLNLDIIFSRIGVLLETIEGEVYSKLIKLILPASVGKDYYMEYEKSYPLSNKEKADIYMKLHSMGYSLRPLIEILGNDFEGYIEDSKYEINELSLRDEIYPPMTSYTMNNDSKKGSPKSEDSDNDSTINTKENDSNKTPRANV